VSGFDFHFDTHTFSMSDSLDVSFGELGLLFLDRADRHKSRF